MLGDHLTERVADEAHLVAERARHLLPRGRRARCGRRLALCRGCHRTQNHTDAPVLAAEAAPLRIRTLAPVMSRPLPATVGVVGLGRFGRLWASMLQSDFRLSAYDSDPGQRAEAEREGLAPASLRDTLAADAVFYCVPISAFEATLKEHLPLFRGARWRRERSSTSSR